MRSVAQRPARSQPAAVILARVSSRPQEEDGTSLDSQVERSLAYAAQRSYSVSPDHVFREVMSGAARLHERDVLTRIRTLARERAIDVVICYAVDRLARSQAAIAILDEEFSDLGVRLEFVTENFENSPTGRFIRSAKSFAAELEREKIIERTSRGRHERVRNGKPLVGPRPIYGYQWADEAKSRLVLNPVTMPVVQRIFQQAALGCALRSIAAQLNADGIPTASGRAPWLFGTVRTLLRNPAYVGRATGWRQQGPACALAREHRPAAGGRG